MLDIRTRRALAVYQQHTNIAAPNQKAIDAHRGSPTAPARAGCRQDAGTRQALDARDWKRTPRIAARPWPQQCPKDRRISAACFPRNSETCASGRRRGSTSEKAIGQGSTYAQERSVKARAHVRPVRRGRRSGAIRARDYAVCNVCQRRARIVARQHHATLTCQLLEACQPKATTGFKRPVHGNLTCLPGMFRVLRQELCLQVVCCLRQLASRLLPGRGCVDTALRSRQQSSSPSNERQQARQAILCRKDPSTPGEDECDCRSV